MDIQDCNVGNWVEVNHGTHNGKSGRVSSVDSPLGIVRVELDSAPGTVNVFFPRNLTLKLHAQQPQMQLPTVATPPPAHPRWFYSNLDNLYYVPGTVPAQQVAYKQLCYYRYAVSASFDPAHPDPCTELDAVWASLQPAPQAFYVSSIYSLSTYNFIPAKFDPTNILLKCNPPTAHTCSDNRIDVGFTHHKYICRICDKDLA